MYVLEVVMAKSFDWIVVDHNNAFMFVLTCTKKQIKAELCKRYLRLTHLKLNTIKVESLNEQKKERVNN